MADMTPEERAEIVLARIFGNTTVVAVAAALKVRSILLDNLREAEASARSKAFEEAAKLCDAEEKRFRDFCNTQPHGTTECGHAGIKAHNAHMLAEAIRARAKEAPRD